MVRKKQDLFERFWSHVDFTATCWLWTGATAPFGYGVFQIGRGVGVVRAHRWVYEQYVGPTEGWFVCHKCDVPACVRPAHLFLGTVDDNARDMAAKGRSSNQLKTHCRQGHPYDSVNTRIEPCSGRRRCRLCEAVQSRKQYLRKKEK